MSEDYRAVLKAQYDYEAQAEDELTVKEDQLLFLIEKIDDEWWKVKLKTDSPDEEGPSGLVPAAYVEQAEHILTVKALYDYDAASSGELSIKEDEILLAFTTEEDWMLVQSQREDGGAGYIPANYVEEVTEAAEETPAPPQAAQIVVPPSPPRPVSTYVDPADRVAATKAKADDIQTWSVSEIDKKGKKKKGTLGVGNGSVFFASESDKTPVQKWPTSSVSNVRIDKSKHVLFDLLSDPSASPLSMHFNAHAKDAAEAVAAKLESSKALTTATTTTNGDEASSPAERVSPKVHFTEAAPEVIPPREPSIDGEEEPEAEPEPEPEVEVEAAPAHEEEEGERATALYDFTADGDDELSVKEGEALLVLEKDGDEWWKCRNEHGQEGVVPANYLELAGGSAPQPEEEDDTAAREAAAAAQQAERQAERARAAEDEARKKREAEQRAKAAAAAAEVERKRKDKEREERERKEETARAEQIRIQRETEEVEARRASESSPRRSDGGESPRPSAEQKRFPPAEKTRVWHDRTGQFRVEAALLGYQNGKLRLHKINGVVIEVPAEKMSVEDMKFVEKAMGRKSSTASAPPPPRAGPSEDDEPLEVRRRSLQPQARPTAAAPKKGPTIDWFEFFLNAGCDVDDCTRYATSFERDKIDEAILFDITESTMRSLGLREGDIIRVKKAIEQRKPKPDAEQLRRDAEVARQLQAQDSGGSGKAVSPAPNLFAAGPNGELKTPRRGRPQPSKTLPPSSVDLNAISTASDQIQRTGTPGSSSSTPVNPPARSSSAVPAAASGFDDDAWTPRPSSTKPTASAPSATGAPRAPSAPPAPAPPAPPAPAPATSPPAQSQGSGSNLAKTNDDLFEQLARLSQYRPPSAPVSPPNAGASMASPASYHSGFGMGSSPAPLGQHLQQQQTGMFLPPQQQQLQPQPTGARGPFAPVPANQTLLQPLVPTQTGFNNFVPTRPSSTASPFQQQQSPFANPPQPTGFPGSQLMAPQPTGFPGSQPMAPQPTGYPGSHPLMSQPTGFPTSGPFLSQPTGFGGGSFGGYGQVNSNPTGFNPGFGQISSPPPGSAPPSSAPKDTSPANVFAQMKSGTFAAGNEQTTPQSADKYDALRPTPTGIPLTAQATGWGYQMQGYQSYQGYQR